MIIKREVICSWCELLGFSPGDVQSIEVLSDRVLVTSYVRDEQGEMLYDKQANKAKTVSNFIEVA